MEIAILAAGSGSRLKKSAEETGYEEYKRTFPNLMRKDFLDARNDALQYPKPLVMIDDKCILDHILSLLHNIRSNVISRINIVVNDTHYPQFVRWLRSYQGPLKSKIMLINNGVKIEEGVRQERVLEDLFLCLRDTHEKVMVMVGDRFYDDPQCAEQMVHASIQSDACVIATDTDKLEGKSLRTQQQILKRTGAVTVNRKGYLASFREKPSNSAITSNTAIGMGWYIIQEQDIPQLAHLLSDPDQKKTDLGHFMEYLLAQNVPVRACDIHGGKYDLGNMRGLLEMRLRRKIERLFDGTFDEGAA